jgi:hypothetical protein
MLATNRKGGGADDGSGRDGRLFLLRMHLSQRRHLSVLRMLVPARLNEEDAQACLLGVFLRREL